MRRWKRRGQNSSGHRKEKQGTSHSRFAFWKQKGQTQTQTGAVGVGRDPSLDRNASTEVGGSRRDTSECALRILLSLCR